MNLLAHAFLSGDNEKLLIGNFIADHIKGNMIKHYPSEVITGIYLHRAIDHYTDNHPVFNKSCNRLYERYHKYSSVIVDIFYDHFLVNHWEKYHNQPIEEFVQNCYSLLLKNYTILPQRTKNLLPLIIIDNWLMAYGKFDGLNRSFKGISTRVKYNPGLENAVFDLKEHYTGFENDFSEFFPELILFTGKKIASLKSDQKK